MLARRFLYLIAIAIALILAVAIVWNVAQDRLLRMAFVPSVAFEAMPDATAPDYAQAGAWLSRPDIRDNPTLWLPPGMDRKDRNARAATFYVPPTTYLGRDRWNAPLDDPDANGRLLLFGRSQASAFADLGPVWAPRYRQATLGTFLAATDPRAQKAIDFAFRDVLRAFDAFVAAQPADRPIILAGHSQGALHLLRLLRDRVRGTALTRRIVAVYAVGWPISLSADLPALGLPACRAAGQAGCIAGWQSFANPAEPRLLHDYFNHTNGYAGTPRAGTRMLCTNPLTGTQGGTGAATLNLGALVPNLTLTGAELVPGRVPAACDPQGLLVIGAPPEGFGLYVLPGNNYHVFDYALFWANIRADAATRMDTFERR